MDDDAPPPKRRPDPAPGGKSAFDLWLDRGLHRMFDEVAQEPIPEELLKLIDTDRSK